jgi:hypothetical protein
MPSQPPGIMVTKVASGGQLHRVRVPAYALRGSCMDSLSGLQENLGGMVKGRSFVPLGSSWAPLSTTAKYERPPHPKCSHSPACLLLVQPPSLSKPNQPLLQGILPTPTVATRITNYLFFVQCWGWNPESHAMQSTHSTPLSWSNSYFIFFQNFLHAVMVPHTFLYYIVQMGN